MQSLFHEAFKRACRDYRHKAFVETCEGCRLGYGSQRDHACLDVSVDREVEKEDLLDTYFNIVPLDKVLYEFKVLLQDQEGNEGKKIFTSSDVLDFILKKPFDQMKNVPKERKHVKQLLFDSPTK